MGHCCRSRLCVIPCLILLLFPAPLTAHQEEYLLQIPLRAYLEDRQVSNFGSDPFALFLNDRPQEIVGMVPGSRSIGEPTPLGRNFILSLFIGKIDPLITRGIAHFLEQVFRDNDRLLLITAAGQYEIKGTRNRQRMLQRLKDLHKRDWRQFRKRKFTAERHLLMTIRLIKESARTSLFSLLHNSHSPQTLPNHLSTFPSELSMFKNQYIHPPYARLRLILDEWPGRGGETYWIHFHNRQVSEVLSRTRSMVEALKTQLCSFFNDRALVQGMDAIQSELRATMPVSIHPFLDSLLRRDVCFFSVLTGNSQVADPGSNLGTDSMLVKNFRNLTRPTGGLMIASSNPLDDWKRIIGHRDTCLRISCAAANVGAKNSVRIETRRSRAKLFYRRRFSGNEVKDGPAALTASTPMIDNLHRKGDALAFSISRFQIAERDKFGLLMVKIVMRDSRNALVYGNEKTLRTHSDPVNISLAFRTPKRGDMTVTISVFDLLANSRVDRIETLPE